MTNFEPNASSVHYGPAGNRAMFLCALDLALSTPTRVSSCHLHVFIRLPLALLSC